VLLLLVTALSQVMAKIPMAVSAGVMVIVAVKTFSWHSIRPGELAQSVAGNAGDAGDRRRDGGNQQSGDRRAGGDCRDGDHPRRLRAKAQATSETASPDPEK
jgi:SulP family sulfate permease